jgi:hypothetical protein
MCSSRASVAQRQSISPAQAEGPGLLHLLLGACVRSTIGGLIGGRTGVADLAQARLPPVALLAYLLAVICYQLMPEALNYHLVPWCNG